MMQRFLRLKCSQVCFLLITVASITNCPGQSPARMEDSLPQALRNRSDVGAIVQNLRILRRNETHFGENHPNKQSTRLQIRDLESELKEIQERFKMTALTSTLGDASTKMEETLPKEIRNRRDVALIVEKLRFLRTNEKVLGPNHPNRESTQLQISKQEYALDRIMQLGHLPDPKFIVSESWPLELKDHEDVLPVIQKTLFLKIKATSLEATHPSQNSIREQIRKNETVINAKAKLGQRPSDRVDRTTQELQDRKEVREIVQKLAYLRRYESNFGENHPNRKTVQTEIQEQEVALAEIIMLDQEAIRTSMAASTTGI